MAGFEPWSSDANSNSSDNCASTTVPMSLNFFQASLSLVKLLLNYYWTRSFNLKGKK